MNPGTTTAVNIEVSRKRAPLSPDEPQTLGELFLQAAGKYPLDNALNYKKDGEWASISSAEMIARIENIAPGFTRSGCPTLVAAIARRFFPPIARNGRWLTPAASSPVSSTFLFTLRFRRFDLLHFAGFRRESFVCRKQECLGNYPRNFARMPGARETCVFRYGRHHGRYRHFAIRAGRNRVKAQNSKPKIDRRDFPRH